jgi:hypothetical protein
MKMTTIGIIIMLISPSLLAFQIWLLYVPSGVRLFAFGAMTRDTFYYAYLLPSWIFLVVTFLLGLVLFIIGRKRTPRQGKISEIL